MERFLVKNALWVVIILVYMHAYKCCVERERIGLLELKAFFKTVTDAPDEFLISWDDDSMSDCCGWEQVKCDATTGRVTELSLTSQSTYFSPDDGFRILNVSLFHPFEELLSLDLSQNWFDGWVGNEGSESFLSLKKLEILDLHSNYFNNSIFPSLSSLTSLKTLILNGNSIEGSFPSRELANMRNLETLGLSENRLNGSLPTQGFESFLSLKKLENLDLGYNDLNNIFPSLSSFTSLKTLILNGNSIAGSFPSQELANMKNLEILGLSSTRLNGSLPTQGLCEMKNLVELDLSSNEFSGSLPQCLRNLTYLRVLDLTSNELSGNVPSVISNLTSLEYLSLYYNNFEGLFSFSSLANHSKLQVFQLSSESINFHVETENFPWPPTFQLKFLRLTNCNLTRNIPRFLLYQYDLRFIDLSHNNLVRMFPTWLLQNNSKLEALYLKNNSLTETLQLPISVQDLLHLDISSNGFSGELPRNIGVILPKLSLLNMSTNSFEGSVPSSIGKMKRLRLLDLSNNNFSGDVPRQLFTNCMSLRFLKLSDNSFHGELIPNYMNLTELMYLHLNNNSFSGKVGTGLLSSTWLMHLDISDNIVSGEIPHWMGSFSHLEFLVLSKNHLKGPIPVELCSLTYLYVLDLSQNMLSGSMPSCFNLSSLLSLSLQKNGLSGPISHVLSRSSYLETLDLRDNQFSGSIPYWINRLPELRVLLLGGNHLHGHIPNILCRLRNVRIMDLSRNKLNGSIPSCFNHMSFALARDDVYGYLSTGEFVDTIPSVYNTTLDSSMDTEFDLGYSELVEVEFTTKSRRGSYKGDILKYMAGLDLSCNELTGEIPQQMGDLREIHALNLSYNSLSGSIPESLSNLTQIESLDLSHNKLSGQVPPQLTELNFLSSFNVSYNNLSGTISDKGQFGTFDESSYRGNPGLCGSMIKKSCTSLDTPPYIEATEEDETVIDLTVFYWSFAASYVTILLVLLVVLCINPHWRRAWFHFIDVCISSCFGRPIRRMFVMLRNNMY